MKFPRLVFKKFKILNFLKTNLSLKIIRNLSDLDFVTGHLKEVQK